MIAWTIQWTILSLVLIILLHYLYSFFIETLTVPKVKDLVNKPIERYNDILSDISKKSNDKKQEKSNDMQTELRDFLSNIKKEPKTAAIQPAANSFESSYTTY